jgi:FAD/FMN-containing dehydrogenase/Fe-S oxidoreductase
VSLPTPAQLHDDLRGLFRGRLRTDAVARTLYSTDASPFQVTPFGVAEPRDETDLRELVKYAQEVRLPLVPRGAGTGLAGEALGPGLIVDLSVHFRAVTDLGPDAVTAGAGVTHADLNAALAPHGRRFAPDPASGDACTVGGMVATNASGGNALRHGYTRDHVTGLRVVWDDGEPSSVLSPSSFDNPLTPQPGRVEPRTTDEGPRTIEIHAQTAGLLASHREVIHQTRPRTRFDRCGYVLHDVLTPAGVDLPRLLTGSEGTLGFVTAATLRTIPLPGGTCRVVLGFPSFDAGVLAGLSTRGADGLAGCDLLDARQVAVARTSPDALGPIPPEVGAVLVLTLEADTERAAVAAGRAAVEALRAGHPLIVLAEPSCDPDALDRIQKFRRAAAGGLYALGAGPRPVAFVEDVAVPCEELPRFVAGVRDILQRFDLAGSLLAHVPAGQVHTRPFLDLDSPADRAKMWPVAEAVHGFALALGGTVSTQHGTGLARTPWVEKQSGPLLPVFRELKRIFDPAGILNPGKIVGPDPSRPAWPLRAVSPASDASQKRSLLLAPATAAAACNGCGDCRTRTPPARMCPVFRARGDEDSSPRAKANLLRGLLAADPADPPAPADVRAVADLCVNCHMCRSECRAGVDIPRLVLAAKAADHAERGLDRTDWVMARIESLAALAGNFSFTSNLLLGTRASRWALEKVFGLSRHRTMPRFTHRTFLRRAKRAGLTQKSQVRKSQVPSQAVSGLSTWDLGLADLRLPKVAYFVDVFPNYNDPLIGEAAVAVLRHSGVEVHVPPRQKGSGMAPLAQGDVDTAREVAGANVRVFADLVREGYTVVCSEPTAALAISREYPDLLDDPDAKLVADNTVELTAYLWGLHQAGRLRTDFRRLDVTLGHHVPCHLKALKGPAVGPRLLELIPGVTVRTIDKSCSGIAATWGMRAENYEASLAAGKPMLDEMRRPGVLFGSTECGTCRLQMQEGSGKRTLHPVQYLALAYGLLPEVGAKLTKPLGALVTD